MTDRLARHPNLTAWAVLALGMLVILAWSARGMELNPRQWLALGAATVLLAGACAWIISWEADADEGEAAAEPEPAADGSDRDTEPEPAADGSDRDTVD